MEHIQVSHASGSEDMQLEFSGKTYKTAIGKNGVTTDKKEGDAATPVGCFPIREVLYRSDRLATPKTALPIRALKESDGWCDDSADEKYNQWVELPYEASHEELWRDDHVYDIIVILGYNDNPPVPQKGSAIFMHIARETYSGTAGCIALSLEDLLAVLEAATLETLVCVAK